MKLLSFSIFQDQLAYRMFREVVITSIEGDNLEEHDSILLLDADHCDAYGSKSPSRRVAPVRPVSLYFILGSLSEESGGSPLTG